MNFLILRDVGSEHTGTYTCVAFNPVGQERSSAELWVNGNNELYLATHHELILVSCKLLVLLLLCTSFLRA